MKTIPKRMMCFLAGTFFFCGATLADSLYWNKPGEGSWSDPVNWGGAEPTVSDSAYIQNRGTSVCENAESTGTFWLGESNDGDGTLVLDDPVASLTVANNFYWGRRASGTFLQSAGTFVVTNSTQMGYFPQGMARYVLSDGTGVFHSVTVGNSSGKGQISQSGGLIQFLSGATISTDGAYDLTDGTAETFSTLTVSGGRMRIDGTDAVFHSPGGANVYVGNGNNGTIEICNGVMTNLAFYVGHQKTGTVTQVDGTVFFQAGKPLGMGTYSTGHGVWNLYGGTLKLAKYSSAYRSLDIGSKANAAGVFNIGTTNGCGMLSEQLAGTGMIVGNGGIGLFQGWSEDGSGNRISLSGTMYLNRGRLVAKGCGTDRALDLTGFTGFYTTVDNALDGNFGCYAQDHGELRLPIFAVSGNNTYYWGEQGGLDLVNGAQLVFEGASGTLTGKLYAIDHGDVHSMDVPAGVLKALSVHEFTVGTMNACDLAIRYDHNAAAEAELAEEDLRLYQWNGTEWKERSSTVDPATRTIAAQNLSNLGQFLVGRVVLPRGTLLSIW